MTGSEKTVVDFLSSLRDKLAPSAALELKRLVALKQAFLKERGEEPDDQVLVGSGHLDTHSLGGTHHHASHRTKSPQQTIETASEVGSA